MTRTAAVLACALVAASSAAAGPRAITLRDAGKTFTVARGTQLQLRLSHRTWRWSAVRASGRAISLTRVVFVRDPGYDEWLVRARSAGRATISATGQIPCRASPCPPTPIRLFRVKIVVR